MPDTTERIAHIWDAMSAQAREVMRMCNMELGEALDDLVEEAE